MIMMGLQEIVSWYQKKIGTYDKQQWERTVEQRILHGLTHVPKKTAKLKTELIDVDLVRGSSFPKAKPKHGLLTVMRLAIVRLLLLPAYSRWWVQQTSPRVFALLLMLYCLQLFNMSLYCCCCLHMPEEVLEHVTASEVLVPAAMMLVLSMVHSQIIAPHMGPLRPPRAPSGRRVRRPRRRAPAASRARSHGSDSKSSPETGSEKTGSVGENLHTYSKHVRLGRLQLVEEHPVPAAGAHRETTPLDDDGFESLNGNGSSEGGEEGREEAAAKAPSWPVPTVGAPEGCGDAAAPDRTPADAEGAPCGLSPSDGSIPGPSWAAGATAAKPYHERWVQEILTARKPSADTICDSESDGAETSVRPAAAQLQRERLARRRGTQAPPPVADSSCNSSCESEDVETVSSPGTGGSCPLLTEGTTSAAEWMGITTNSEECSYSSELDESDTQREFSGGGGGGTGPDLNEHPFAWEFELSPTIILNPSCAASDRVSCTVWEKRDPKKADLSVLDISSAIIARVESMPENMDYFYGGLLMALVLALLPSLCRLDWGGGAEPSGDSPAASSVPVVPAVQAVSTAGSPALAAAQLGCSVLTQLTHSLAGVLGAALGSNGWERIAILIAMFERCVLAALFFFLLAVAERTFKQRFLYAKLFSHLTSFRRARKSELPHFRLNKVRNIKTWLSVRSYLKRRGPQRSVDVIVSAAFLITLLLLSFLSVECLKDSVRLHSEYNLEALVWCLVLGVFLLRFMTLGTKINRKYRNLSVLITEQINLYLQIEQKPNKKEELMVANSVLKLAADLLKELESPFKISGLSANPYLYTITKVVILSALSGVLSEMLGFKLKLHKIKINNGLQWTS